jgi:hypothetical protein
MPKKYPPFIESFILKVNLPNDPYYWEEILDTFPKDDYRASFGRGYTAEWWFKAGSSYTSPIIIDYKIHPDTIRRDLDNSTMTSLEYAKKADFWGYIALVIAIISIPSVIWSSRDFIKWIKEKINNRP